MSDPWGHGRFGNLLYNPVSTYGGNFAPGEFAQTGAYATTLLDEPRIEYERRINAQGDPFTTRSSNLRGLWQQVHSGFQSALATNPALKLQDYLNGVDLDALYRSQTYAQRGENPARFAPRARTISRGFS